MLVSGNKELSKSQLDQEIIRASNGLRAIGVKEGDCVALLLRNDFPFVIMSAAAGSIGAYATPINWHYTESELQYILEDCNAKALLVHADMISKIANLDLKNVAVISANVPPEIETAYNIDRMSVPEAHKFLDWDEWLSGCDTVKLEEKLSPGSMIYTSGTTGDPKGVRREAPTKKAFLNRMAMIKQTFGLYEGADYVALVNGPMYHSAPNAYAMHACIFGGTVVFHARFDAEETLQLIEKYKISHMHIVPTMFKRLLQLPKDVREKYDLSSLKFVVHGAAPCPPNLKQEMISWWGNVIYEYYGATELNMMAFINSEEALKYPGSVGRSLANRTVKVFSEQGEELGANEIGLLYANIPEESDFTYHGKDSKRQEIELQGMVTLGDVGYKNEDGYIYICDRLNDMVISGGVNIYPAEVEKILLSMPRVKDCAVFGIPNEEYGEELCAYIELDDKGDDITEEDVIRYLRKDLASFKVPRIVKFAQSLPREDSGKIFKRKLRDPYWENSGRMI